MHRPGLRTSDLFQTVEDLRRQKYEHLPRELVAEILALEEAYLDDDSGAEALRRVEQAVERYLEGDEGHATN